MKKNIPLTLKILSFLPLAALVCFMTMNTVNAAPVKGSGQALEIAPPVLNLSADPGDVIHTKINLRDISNVNLIVVGQVNDFTAGGEDGTPKILTDGETTEYSIKSWVTALPTLNLKPHEVRTLPITIVIPANAAPGGYYGTIRFTASAPDIKGTGVALSASLGSLVLLRVNGDAHENMSIESFTANKNNKTGWLFESAPLQFNQRLKNNGNVFEKPSGLVTVTDMFGKTVATLPINQPPSNVLPQSVRKFTENLDSSVIGNKFLFGHYTANLSVKYGANNQELTSKISFWVIPYKLILAIIIIAIIGFFFLRRLIKRYNRHIIAQAKKSKR